MLNRGHFFTSHQTLILLTILFGGESLKGAPCGCSGGGHDLGLRPDDDDYSDVADRNDEGRDDEQHHGYQCEIQLQKKK